MPPPMRIVQTFSSLRSKSSIASRDLELSLPLGEPYQASYGPTKWPPSTGMPIVVGEFWYWKLVVSTVLVRESCCQRKMGETVYFWPPLAPLLSQNGRSYSAATTVRRAKPSVSSPLYRVSSIVTRYFCP